MAQDLVVLQERLDWAVKLARSGKYDFNHCVTVTEQKPYAEDVAAAIIRCKSSKGDMAILLRVKRSALSKFIAEIPDLQALLDSEREHFLDKIESSVHDKALAGDWKAQRFILSTIGRARGYGNKLEVDTHHDGAFDILLKHVGEQDIKLPGLLIDGEVLETTED